MRPESQLIHRSRSPNPAGAATGRERAELAPLKPKPEGSIHSVAIEDGLNEDGVPDDFLDESQEKGPKGKRGSTDPLVEREVAEARRDSSGAAPPRCSRRQCPCSRNTALALTAVTLCLAGAAAAAGWWFASGEAGPPGDALPG